MQATREDRRLGTEPPTPTGAANNQTLLIELAELRAELRAQREQTATAMIHQESPVDQVVPVMTIEALQQRDSFIKQVITGFFVEGVHFGVPFPGAKDKDGNPIRMLYKVGAEWFASAFGVRPHYEPLETITSRGENYVFYRYRCELVCFRTGQVIGSAEGVCTSEEAKYKYRNQHYKCPSCQQETIMKSKWGGWYCSQKHGGCNAKYPAGEASIENQPKPGRSLNTEVLEQAHTISSMAQKRAFVLAVKGAFGLGAYIQYFEGIDDEEIIIDGTATIKGDVPESVKQFNGKVQAEKEETPWAQEHDKRDGFINWSRRQWTDDGQEPPALSRVYDGVALALGLSRVPKGRKDLHALMEAEYTGTKEEAMAAVQGYFLAPIEESELDKHFGPRAQEDTEGSEESAPALCANCGVEPADADNPINGTLCATCAARQADKAAS